MPLLNEQTFLTLWWPNDDFFSLHFDFKRKPSLELLEGRVFTPKEKSTSAL